jgi:hypothetical protein
MHLRSYFVPCGKSLVTNVASRFLPLIEVVPTPQGWVQLRYSSLNYNLSEQKFNLAL